MRENPRGGGGGGGVGVGVDGGRIPGVIGGGGGIDQSGGGAAKQREITRNRVDEMRIKSSPKSLRVRLPK